MKDLEEMTAEFEQAIVEFEADTGLAGEEIWFDLAVSTCQILLQEEGMSKESRVLAREFCRTQIGMVPQDLEPYLGENDWVQ